MFFRVEKQFLALVHKKTVFYIYLKKLPILDAFYAADNSEAFFLILQYFCQYLLSLCVSFSGRF